MALPGPAFSSSSLGGLDGACVAVFPDGATRKCGMFGPAFSSSSSLGGLDCALLEFDDATPKMMPSGSVGVDRRVIRRRRRSVDWTVRGWGSMISPENDDIGEFWRRQKIGMSPSSLGGLDGAWLGSRGCHRKNDDVPSERVGVDRRVWHVVIAKEPPSAPVVRRRVFSEVLLSDVPSLGRRHRRVMIGWRSLVYCITRRARTDARAKRAARRALRGGVRQRWDRRCRCRRRPAAAAAAASARRGR